MQVIHRSLVSLSAVLSLVGLAACGGGGGQGGNASSAPTTKTLSITSSYTGEAYPITIYVPATYTGSSGAEPVIYTMDSELQSTVVLDAVQALKLDAIVVTIGYVSPDRRFVDFDLPGASDYFKFLTLELIPRIDAEYRTDKTRRTLMGYSLSGLMAMIALLEDGPSPRYFSGFVMTDPSLQFHTQNLYNMEQTLWSTTHDLPVTVHHCSTAEGSPSAQLQDVIQRRGYQGLHYQFRIYPLDHGTVLAPCVNDGLRWVFESR
jgi:predicted alpha/beta superfamily hydrolase